jgi:hypothetical protein
MMRGALIYFGLDQNSMKDIFALVTVAIVALLLLITGTGATNFISPAYAPEPARLRAPEDPKPPFSLTGVWKANDGGTYYLRHIGYNILWWNGMSGNDGLAFNNVFKGTITWGSTNTIAGDWADVPRGNIMGSGMLNVKITSPTTLQKGYQYGNDFRTVTWQKVG